MLDLALTDLEGEVECEVLLKLADHALVLCKVHSPVPKTVEVTRECWFFAKGNWKAFDKELQDINCNEVFFRRGTAQGPHTSEDVDLATERFIEHLLRTLRKHVPVRKKVVTKSSHSWVDDHCLELVAKKREAEGTEAYAERLKECSEGLLEAYRRWVAKTGKKLLELPCASKRWWKLARVLAQKTEKSSSIPPLKRADGTWTTKAVDKAELFLEIFGGKYKPLQPQSNEHIDLGEAAHNSTAYFLVVRTKHAEAHHQQLRSPRRVAVSA